MRLLPFSRRSLAGLLALPLLLGCQDELPTATGADFFPGGARPVSVELLLQPEQFLLSDTVFAGNQSPHWAGFLLVANRFENALDARGLVRFTSFPDSVTYAFGGTTHTTAEFTYGGGEVRTVVNPLASTAGVTRLRLYELEQPFDTAGASWTVAGGRTDPVLWRTPGGTTGRLLAEATWTPGDTAQADTIRFGVDSLAVARMAQPGYPGLLITSETAGSRLQLSWANLEARVRPAAHDTVVTQFVAGVEQTFIFTPEAPQTGRLRVGGITGDRSVLALNLAQQVPACPDPANTPNCPMVPLSSVNINRATLILPAQPTPGGLRPLQAPSVRVRRVLEPELGRFAPLGPLLFADTLAATHFAAGGAPVMLDLTGAITRLVAEGVQQPTIALLTEPEGGQFGYLYFADRPRLRVIYTLPLRPTFP
jgi:hypothetical protein